MELLQGKFDDFEIVIANAGLTGMQASAVAREFYTMRDRALAAEKALEDALAASGEVVMAQRQRAEFAEHSAKAEREAHVTTRRFMMMHSVSPTFEAFVRDAAWHALEAFSIARSNMESWPDDMVPVENALMTIHSMALRVIAQPSAELSKTG